MTGTNKRSGTPQKKMDHMGMDNASSDIVTLNYGMLKATKETNCVANRLKIQHNIFGSDYKNLFGQVSNKTTGIQ
jgi:hypothetical protein